MVFFLSMMLLQSSCPCRPPQINRVWAWARARTWALRAESWVLGAGSGSVDRSLLLSSVGSALFCSDLSCLSCLVLSCLVLSDMSCLGTQDGLCAKQ
jgi:hypothetical protein